MKTPQAKARTPRSLVRPHVQELQAYVPGEQPKVKGLVKLNTNENPYAPSPKVLATVQAAVDERLRLYPDPTAEKLRERLARLHGCQPDQVLVGNGSDELLALATRAFVEPAPEGALAHWSKYPSHSGPKLNVRTVQYFTPSYSLYPVLADIHAAAKVAAPLESDFSLPTLLKLRRGKVWNFYAALTFITTPNAPSGRGYPTAELEALCQAMEGVVWLDEAYAEFADDNALSLAFKYPHVIVSRTFSKAYSLCYQRVGYCVGHAELIAALQRIKDSYNVNGLGQVAALASLDDLTYYRANFRRLKQARTALTADLTGLGFTVLPSQTNFILARPPTLSAEVWQGKLREHKILVRWFGAYETRDYLRISLGTDDELAALLKAVRAILKD
ncbi:MAG: aminotransferase class I/II-fold pyridoxal phosphate-dependent enzyme [Verrucomicrobia bacterium]|nr:aminotransferase class I/II-fold pyridoxal phosphate-dependent enzyme [Verrucomicrobiota bacterium]